jgi:hypothetical protein
VGKSEVICEHVLGYETGPQGEMFDIKKTGGQKSRETLPLSESQFSFEIVLRDLQKASPNLQNVSHKS